MLLKNAITTVTETQYIVTNAEVKNYELVYYEKLKKI